MTFHDLAFPADLDSLAGVFLDVYCRPPWNDGWESKEHAAAYLNHIAGMNGYRGFCIRNEGKITGAALGYINKWYKGDEFYINEFFIAHDLQRQGWGSRLLDHVQKEMADQDVQCLTLSTRREYPAFQFYTGNRFKPIDSLTFLYRNADQ